MNVHTSTDVGTQQDASTAEQTDNIDSDPNSIYSEENVERLMAEEERAGLEVDLNHLFS